MQPLTIHGWGVVSPVGLTTAQTCAAVRARVSGFREMGVQLGEEEGQLIAPVPAKRLLRVTPGEWLLSLASRAIGECLSDEWPDTRRTALIVVPPDEFRRHPGADVVHHPSLVRRIENTLHVVFHGSSMVLAGGPAAVFQGLVLARELLADPTIDYCVVGGVDSLINDADLTRLRASGRLKRGDNPQGLVPGEGAAFVLLSGSTRWRRFRPLAQILGAATAHEPDTVLGPKYSIGDGLRTALAAAAAEIDGGESSIDFVTSTFNGERYGAWEAMLAHPRFYRTPRQRLEIAFPAMSVGDIGTAAPALAVIVASMAMARTYAPGMRAMCDASSDEGLRGACVIGGPPEPPAFVKPGRRAT